MKLFKNTFFHFIAFIAVAAFVFRDLLLNLKTNLPDWRDYPFYIWQMYQNVSHLTNLDFINFFETNAFYPNKLTLLFLDTMLPQSLIFLPLLSLTQNLIASLNLTLILTFILNLISVYIFFKYIFKNGLIAFFGSLFFNFSPYFHLEVSHLPVLTYWPFFLGIYFFLKGEAEGRRKNFIVVGLFLLIQFLASVYLSAFMIFAILTFCIVSFFFNPSYTEIKKIFLKTLIIFSVFLATSGIFIKGYLDMKDLYNAKRDIREYIWYSADLSDYFFTTGINSVIHQSPLMDLWNKANKNPFSVGMFPGFLVFILAFLALFKISRSRQELTINLKLDREKTYFLTLLILGFLFSLGPYLNFNGTFAYIPLPYKAVIKFVPMLEAVRTIMRWSFFFFLGFTYFALLTLQTFEKKRYFKFIILGTFIFFILEYLPFNLESSKEDYLTADHSLLKNLCSKEKQVLLELPVTHLHAYPDIKEGLKYITTTVQLSSIYHGCFLVNGYSGYDLPGNFKLADTLNEYIKNQETEEFVKKLRSKNIDLVKFNSKYFATELKPSLDMFIQKLEDQNGVEKINNNIFSLKSSENN